MLDFLSFVIFARQQPPPSMPSALCQLLLNVAMCAAILPIIPLYARLVGPRYEPNPEPGCQGEAGHGGLSLTAPLPNLPKGR